MQRVAALSILLGLMLPTPTPAEVYTYKDASGTVTYVDDLGKIPGRYRSQAKTMDTLEDISIIEADSPPAGKARAGTKQPAKQQAKAKTRFSGTIEMYVTEWCPVCKNAESYLKKMGYAYSKYDVEKDKNAKARAADYPGRGVPLIIIGKRTMRGFSPEALEQYMEN